VYKLERKVLDMENVQYDAETLEFLAVCDHFTALQNELGYESIWSMHDMGIKGLDFEIFTNKVRKVTYEYIRPDATQEELMLDLRDGGKRSVTQVSMTAIDGSIKSLWFAAESCIKQSGTHHRYIEDFEFGEDGTLELVTGS
jgi:hypothetical protein